MALPFIRNVPLLSTVMPHFGEEAADAENAGNRQLASRHTAVSTTTIRFFMIVSPFTFLYIGYVFLPLRIRSCRRPERHNGRRFAPRPVPRVVKQRVFAPFSPSSRGPAQKRGRPAGCRLSGGSCGVWRRVFRQTAVASDGRRRMNMRHASFADLFRKLFPISVKTDCIFTIKTVRRMGNLKNEHRNV